MKLVNKESLSLVGQAFDGAIAHELGDGAQDNAVLKELGIAPQRFRTVAGFKVVSNANRDADVDADAAGMTDRLLRYRSDKSLLTAKLSRAGIEPIAIMPRTAWERICDCEKLFRFQPKGDKVFATSEKLLVEINKAVDIAAVPIRKGRNNTCRVVVLGLLIGVATFTVFCDAPWWVYALETACALVIIGFGYGINLDYPDASVRRELQGVVLNDMLAKLESESGIAPLLWPNLREQDAGNKGCVSLQLPEPTLGVQDKLVRLEKARLPVQIAAVNGAFGVSAKIDNLHIESYAKDSSDCVRDPIIYVTEGSAVAIVEQYGDFSIEQDVITEVINSVHLI